MTGSLPTTNDQPCELLVAIELEIPASLNRAAQAVVRSKTILDAAAADYNASMLARDLHDGAYGPAEPLPFLCRIVPFAFTLERKGAPVMARVPTANTLGCSWRWRRSHLDDTERAKCRAELDNEPALLDGTLNDASYAWIKPLGLIAPGEGKNRVDFFRGEGIDSIPANVSEWTYAEPSRIALYSVKDSAFEATWAVLDGRWVEPVANPSWTNPLMAAYGVATEQSWPKTYPAPADVIQALFDYPRFNSPLGNPDHKRFTLIDLETIKAIDEFQNERLRATVHELKGVRIDHRVWQGSILGVLASIVLLALLPERWVEARIACGILMGAAGCFGVLPYLSNIITVPRTALAKEHYLPRERSPKSAGRQGKHHLG